MLILYATAMEIDPATGSTEGMMETDTRDPATVSTEGR